MARLQWEQVRAPDLSIRDLAIAGQQVSSGFDRLASMFQQRYQQQRQEATDKAVAGILATTDPSQLMNVDPSQFGENVDTRAVLEATNQQRRGLLVEADTREDLLNKQALSQFGPEISQGMEAYYAGDETAKAALVTRAAEDPMFARAMGAYTEQFFDAFTTGVDDRQQALEHRDLVADRAAGRNLQERGLALEGARLRMSQDERAQTENGMSLGIQLAEKYRTLDPADARQQMLEDPLYRDAPARTRLGIESVFERNQGILSTPSGEAAAALSPTLRENAALSAGLSAAANRAENQQRTPELTAVRLSRELEGKITADEVIDKMFETGPYVGILGGRGKAQEDIERTIADVNEELRKDFPDLSPASYADVQAALNTFGTDRSIFRNPFGRSQLTNQVRDIVEARNRGYGQNAEIDIATARAPYENKLRQLARAEQAAMREIDANGTISSETEARLNKIRDEIRKLR